MRATLSLFFSLLVLFHTAHGQGDSASPKVLRKRKILLVSGSAALTLGSFVYLNQAWYQQYSTGRFHFFNDNTEWLQMDKAGHTFSGYQMGRLMTSAFTWAGYKQTTAMIAGVGVGFVFLNGVEIMDGFSRGWGFSWGDELADVLGASLAFSQEALWHEQRLQLKFSYASSGLAKYNPSVLGNGFGTRLLKDYNAQTYWLSFNPFVLAGKKDRRFLPWLNLSLGYGAYGMLGGEENNVEAKDDYGNVLHFERRRRFFLSLDLDLTRIPTKSKALKTLFSVLNMVKVPAPALEWMGGKSSFYFLR